MALARKKEDGWSRSLTLPGPESVGDLLSGLGRPALPALAANREERRAFTFRCLVAALLRTGELPLPVTLGLPDPGDDAQLFALIAPGGGERLVRVLLLPEEQWAPRTSEDDQLLSAADETVFGTAFVPDRVHVLRGTTVTLHAGGKSPVEVDLSRAYEVDYVAWIQAQARLLRSGDARELDRFNLAEEIESLGRSDRHALSSHLRNLLLHLLKWQHQRSRRSRSWRSSMLNARGEILEKLEDSPSLAAPEELEGLIGKQYPRARKEAAVQTGLPLATFPEVCPYTPEQLLDDDFPPLED